MLVSRILMPIVLIAGSIIAAALYQRKKHSDRVRYLVVGWDNKSLPIEKFMKILGIL